MRNVVSSRAVPSVGGFITILSNRDAGFRFSVYSDVMLDWPTELHGNQELRLTDKFDLRASGENDRYSISQISPGHYDMNAVAFYVLKGRLLVVFIAVRRDVNALRGKGLKFRALPNSARFLGPLIRGTA